MPTPLEGWRVEQQRAGLLETSIYHHVGLISAFEKFLGRDALSATRDDIQTWLDSRPLSAKTRYDYLSCLSTFYRWCVFEELLDVNPCDRIRRPKLRRYLPRPIPGNDLEVALRAADERMRAWLLLGAMAGCRCMEIANLDTQDIHREGEPVLLLRGKGGKERIVPMHPIVEMALDVVRPHKAGPVFIVGGARIRPQRVSALVSQFLRGLGIDATAHQLRHKFGTDVYRLSKDIRLTQELLGHASPQTTSVYAAWSPSEGRRIVDLLESPSPLSV